MDPVVDSSLKFAQGISEFGILVVIAACFLMMSFWMMRFFVQSMRKTNVRILETQEGMIKELSNVAVQNKSFQNLLQKIADSELDQSLIEQTKENSYSIIRESFNKNILDILSGATGIIEKNNIIDKVNTRRKITSVVENAHRGRVIRLNKYKYKGTKLGDFANDAHWVEKKIEIVENYIYSENRDSQSLIRELRMACDNFGYQLNI